MPVRNCAAAQKDARDDDRNRARGGLPHPSPPRRRAHGRDDGAGCDHRQERTRLAIGGAAARLCCARPSSRSCSASTAPHGWRSRPSRPGLIECRALGTVAEVPARPVRVHPSREMTASTVGRTRCAGRARRRGRRSPGSSPNRSGLDLLGGGPADAAGPTGDCSSPSALLAPGRPLDRGVARDRSGIRGRRGTRWASPSGSYSDLLAESIRIEVPEDGRLLALPGSQRSQAVSGSRRCGSARTCHIVDRVSGVPAAFVEALAAIEAGNRPSPRMSASRRTRYADSLAVR